MQDARPQRRLALGGLQALLQAAVSPSWRARRCSTGAGSSSSAPLALAHESLRHSVRATSLAPVVVPGQVRRARHRPTGTGVTRRRSSYRSLASLQRDNRRCRACVEAGYPLESLPVVEGTAGQRAYMFGQAPGIVEGEERRPWRGRAGQTLRRWLELDEDEFYATFYCAVGHALLPGPGAVRAAATAPRRRAEQRALRVLARLGAARSCARG